MRAHGWDLALCDAGGMSSHGRITTNWGLSNLTNPNPELRA